ATCPGSGGPAEAGAREAAVLAAPATGVETEESLLVTPFRYDRESEVPRPVPRRSPCSIGGRIQAPQCGGNPGSCAKARRWRCKNDLTPISLLARVRFMTRTSALARVLLGLCLSRPALADQPTAIARSTKPQVHQAVDRATKYLQTESA